MKLRDYWFVWKTVYSKPKYLILAILIAFTFFILNVFIRNFRVVMTFFNEKGLSQASLLFYNLVMGFHTTIKLEIFVLLVIISSLLGILLTLIPFKISSRAKVNSSGFLGTLGIFLGILAPGCGACGVGLLAVFGIGSATLTLLPFQGLEISLLALALLLFSIGRTSKGLLECKSCQIKLKNN